MSIKVLNIYHIFVYTTRGKRYELGTATINKKVRNGGLRKW